MFKRLLARIDSWGDRINPITVRDLRRLKRWYGLEGFTLFLLAAFVVGFACVLHFVRPIPEYDTPEAKAWILALFLVALTGYGSLGAAFTPLGWLMKSRQIDELFELVPLTPAQRVRGYFDSACVLSVFTWGLVAPFFAALTVIYPVPWFLLLIPFEICLVGPVLLLFFLSFLVRGKGHWQHVVIFLGVFYLGALPVQLSAVGVVFLWFEVFGWPMLFWDRGFGFVSLFVLLPLGLLALGFTAYRLSVSHLEHRRSLGLTLAWNCVVYSVLCIVLGACYLGLAAWVFHAF